MILEFLIAGLLGATPFQAKPIALDPIHLQQSCREPWPGRRPWEVLQLLRRDDQWHVWFLLLPESAFIAPYESAIGAWDHRGAKLVEYDGKQWWQYRIEWSLDLSEARWVISLANQLLDPIRLKAEFFERFKVGHSDDERLAVHGIQVKEHCLSEAPVAENVEQPKIGFEQGRIDRLAPGLSPSEPDWEIVNKPTFYSGYYTSDGYTSWLVSPKPDPDDASYLYHYDGESWEQKYRLPTLANHGFLSQIFEDSKGFLWLATGPDSRFLRYDDKSLCVWEVAPEDILRYPIISAGPNGQVWSSARSPSHGVYTLKGRYLELPLYNRDSLDYSYQKLFRHLDIGPIGELPGEIELNLDFEIRSQLTPIYFDGESWHQTTFPIREPNVKPFDMDFLNRSKRCWPIDQVNRGQVTIPEDML